MFEFKGQRSMMGTWFTIGRAVQQQMGYSGDVHKASHTARSSWAIPRVALAINWAFTSAGRLPVQKKKMSGQQLVSKEPAGMVQLKL